jgi:hypothetical protein
MTLAWPISKRKSVAHKAGEFAVHPKNQRKVLSDG